MEMAAPALVMPVLSACRKEEKWEGSTPFP